MDTINKIKEEVHNYYWNDNINCATTTLKILASNYSVNLSEQVIDSAIGMHGAGEYGAQCGLVEGTLLFIGIYGRLLKLNDKKIVKTCNLFARKFEESFSSLLCRDIRPGGFNITDIDHLCENVTIKAIDFAIKFIDKNILEIKVEK